MNDNIEIVGSVQINDKDLTRLNNNLNKATSSADNLTKAEMKLESTSKVTRQTIKALGDNVGDMANLVPNANSGLNAMSAAMKAISNLGFVGVITGIVAILGNFVISSDKVQSKLTDVKLAISDTIDALTSFVTGNNNAKLSVDDMKDSLDDLNASLSDSQTALDKLHGIDTSIDYGPVNEASKAFDKATVAYNNADDALNNYLETFSYQGDNQEWLLKVKELNNQFKLGKINIEEFRKQVKDLEAVYGGSKYHLTDKQIDPIVARAKESKKASDELTKAYAKLQGAEKAEEEANARAKAEQESKERARAKANREAIEAEHTRIKNEITALQAEYDTFYDKINRSVDTPDSEFAKLLAMRVKLSELQVILKTKELSQTNMSEKQKTSIITNEVSKQTESYNELYDNLTKLGMGTNKSLEKDMGVFAKHAQAQTDKYLKEVNRRIQADKDWAKAKEALETKALNITSKAFAAGAELLESSKEGEEKYFEQIKQLKIASTITSTLQASIDAYKSLEGIPYVGPALAAIESATVMATGMATVNQIRNTTPGTESISSRGVSPTISYGNIGTQTTPTTQQSTQQTQTETRVTMVESDVQRAMSNTTKLKEQTRY